MKISFVNSMSLSRSFEFGHFFVFKIKKYDKFYIISIEIKAKCKN